MKYYLGVTDYDWYQFLQLERPAEVNFWQPGGNSRFRVLPVGGAFLFKLKAPYHAIGGLGFFASHTFLPLSVAWDIFGRSNGTATFSALRNKILGYRRDQHPNPTIGCIVLTDPVFFPEEAWIKVPENWSPSIVQGKSYNTNEPIGRRLWSEVQYRLQELRWLERPISQKDQLVTNSLYPEYREVLSRVRVGQKTFRAMITDVYDRRCAISGEKTLPALEAAHIKPYAESGPHTISNGLLLRSDLHKLFDQGYLTLTNDYRIEVSRRIKEEFENGKEYYRFSGQPLSVLPLQDNQRPAEDFMRWHQERVYRG